MSSACFCIAPAVGCCNTVCTTWCSLATRERLQYLMIFRMCTTVVMIRSEILLKNLSLSLNFIYIYIYSVSLNWTPSKTSCFVFYLTFSGRCIAFSVRPDQLDIWFTLSGKLFGTRFFLITVLLSTVFYYTNITMYLRDSFLRDTPKRNPPRQRERERQREHASHNRRKTRIFAVHRQALNVSTTWRTFK